MNAFITEACKEADAKQETVTNIIQERLSLLSELVGGYDFAKVIEAYWNGHEHDNELLKSNAIRWLRAEYATKTDARKDLGVRTIISDASFYDALKTNELIRTSGWLPRTSCKP